MTCMLYAVLRALVSLFGGQEDFAERPSSKPKISKKIQEAERGQGQSSDAIIDYMRQLGCCREASSRASKTGSVASCD